MHSFGKLVVAFCLSVLVPCLVIADDPPLQPPQSGNPVGTQNVQQKQAQAETKRLANRLETMLRVLSYHQIDATSEQKLMDEAAEALKGLSQQQMQEILKQLEQAVKTPSPVEADQHLDAAQEKHREVLDRFRQLIARFELVRSLDQAAQKFDKLAKEEMLLRERVQRADQQKQDRVNVQRGMRPETPAQQALRQEDIARDTDALLQKLNELKMDVLQDVKPRLEKTVKIADDHRLLETMRDAANHVRYRNAREADDRQIQVQNDLERLARTLRAPIDKLAALQEARDRVQKMIPAQEALRDETEAVKDPRQRDSKENQPAQRAQNIRKMASRQTELQVQTRDTKELIEQHASKVADTLSKADNAMQAAKERLRESQPQKATDPQKTASDRMQEAKDSLDQLVAEEEKRQRDPLVGLEKAIEQLEKLIADEKQAQQKAKDAIAASRPQDLKPQAPKQQALAEKAEEIARKPLAARPAAKDIIQSAAETMHQASEQLFTQQGPPAVTNQEKALFELNKALEMLKADAQAIRDRREQIAQMEEAGKKLDELHKEEQSIAKSADDQAKTNKPSESKEQNEQLAQKQQTTKAKTQDLAKELQKLAEKAADKTQKSTPTMQKASEALKQQQAKQGAEQADKAAQQLAEAKDALNEALAQKMAEEAAAEAMQNPDKVQPGEAAVHVAKALLESKEAAKQSGEAAKQKEQNQQALDKSQSATQSAQSALDQARALSPQNVMPSLNEARQNLDQAKEQLKQNTPSSAQQSQQQAASQLQQALQSLQQTMAAMEKMQGNQQASQQDQQGKEGQNGQKQAKGQKGQQKANQSAQNQPEDKNKQGEPTQNGDRDGNAKAEKLDVKGSSTFVNLPARQRELILQALSEKLPPEHAAQIKRYFENIATGKSATDTKANSAPEKK